MEPNRPDRRRSDARHERAGTPDDQPTGWWAIHGPTVAAWTLGGAVLAFAAGVVAVRGDGESSTFLTVLVLAAMGVGLIGGLTRALRSRKAAALGLAAGVLVVASLPAPAGLGMLTGPAGIASPFLAAAATALALVYAHWRATDRAPSEEPENRAFASPAERRRILRHARR